MSSPEGWPLATSALTTCAGTAHRSSLAHFLFRGAEQEILTGVPLGLSCVFHLREHLGSQVECQVPGHRGTSCFSKRRALMLYRVLENSGPRTELLLPGATVNTSPTILLNLVVVKDLEAEVLNLSAHYSDQTFEAKCWVKLLTG